MQGSYICPQRLLSIPKLNPRQVKHSMSFNYGSGISQNIVREATGLLLLESFEQETR
jgi:hypothetical protein